MEERKLHWIRGVVIHGDGRGRELGFPTANLRLDVESNRPADGIYAAWAQVEGSPEIHRAVMHVGPRPTIPGAEATVEVHLLDVTHVDLYDHALLFAVVKQLRAVEKFNSLEELTTAIVEDCRQAQLLLRETPAFL